MRSIHEIQRRNRKNRTGCLVRMDSGKMAREVSQVPLDSCLELGEQCQGQVSQFGGVDYHSRSIELGLKGKKKNL